MREASAEVFELWPEHEAAWAVFMSCAATQWRLVATGLGTVGYQGLDYGAVEVVMRMRGVPRKARRHAFDGVRVLEAEALKHLNR